MASLDEIYQKMNKEREYNLEQERIREQELWILTEKMKLNCINENNMYNYISVSFGNSGGCNKNKNVGTNSYVDDDYVFDYLY